MRDADEDSVWMAAYLAVLASGNSNEVASQAVKDFKERGIIK